MDPTLVDLQEMTAQDLVMIGHVGEMTGREMTDDTTENVIVIAIG